MRTGWQDPHGRGVSTFDASLLDKSEGDKEGWGLSLPAPKTDHEAVKKTIWY